MGAGVSSSMIVLVVQPRAPQAYPCLVQAFFYAFLDNLTLFHLPPPAPQPPSRTPPPPPSPCRVPGSCASACRFSVKCVRVCARALPLPPWLARSPSCASSPVASHQPRADHTHKRRCLFEIAVRFHANREYDALPLKSNRRAVRVYLSVIVYLCLRACR